MRKDKEKCLGCARPYLAPLAEALVRCGYIPAGNQLFTQNSFGSDISDPVLFGGAKTEIAGYAFPSQGANNG